MVCGSAQAAPLLYTYQFSAANLTDSNSNPPPIVLSPIVGQFSAVLDLSILQPSEDFPQTFSGFTNDAGYTFGFGDTKVLKEFQSGFPVTTFRITLGRFNTGPNDETDEATGLSNDFRFVFFIENDGSISNQFPNSFAYLNAPPLGGAYDGDLSVSLLSVQGPPNPIPVPAPLILMGRVLALFTATRAVLARR